MDRLTYHYKNNTNQLIRVRDAVPAAKYTEDIDDQPANNYDYDAIGNLIQDTKEGISKITWTVYGKIESITKTDGTTIAYSYDAAGNRISKTVTKAGTTNTTAYVRDAQGNVLSIYRTDAAINSGHFTQSELHLYGSSRLGIYNLNKDLSITPPAAINLGSGNSGGFGIFERGKKLFELTNHLGNVLATVSEKKIGVDADNDGQIDYYTADVISAQDYFPFGMMMPGRKYASGGYRYGFNGKEWDNSVKGSGDQIDYGFRMYDNRVGRFLSVDPLIKSYPWYTPYQFAGNSPIANIDIDGREEWWFMSKIALEFVRTKLGLYSAGEQFRKNISDYSAASNNNYGNFDQSGKSGTIQEQVNANAQKALTSRVGIYADFTKGTSISMGLAASPFVSVASAAALPELFVVSGSSQLSTLGSYLVKKTFESSIDVAAQKLVNGKVDWADVVSNYLPVKGKMNKVLLEVFQASVDYSGNGEWAYLGCKGQNEKTISDALIDGYASFATNKVFGRFNKEIEKVLKSKGFSKDKLANVMGEFIKTQNDFIKNSVKTGIAEATKDLSNPNSER